MAYFTFFKLRESMKPHEYFTRKHISVQTPRVQVLSGHMRLAAWSWRSSPTRWLWARGDVTRGRHVLGLPPACRARWHAQARTRNRAHLRGLCEDPGPTAHARQARRPGTSPGPSPTDRPPHVGRGGGRPPAISGLPEDSRPRPPPGPPSSPPRTPSRRLHPPPFPPRKEGDRGRGPGTLPGRQEA